MKPLPGGRRNKRRSGLFLILLLAAVPSVSGLSSCVFGKNDAETDTVSANRSQLIVAAGGFICLYRDGSNPADLLYVKDTANKAGLQVIFKIAESEVIPEAVRKGWGDVAVGFTEAEAKKLGLRIVPLPRAEGDFKEDAGTNVILLRPADDFLDALLNPEKRKTDSPGNTETLPADLLVP